MSSNPAEEEQDSTERHWMMRDGDRFIYRKVRESLTLVLKDHQVLKESEKERVLGRGSMDYIVRGNELALFEYA